MIIIPRNPEPLMSRLEELGVQHKRLRLYGVDLVVAWPDVDPSSLGLGSGDVVIPGGHYQLSSSKWRRSSVVRVGGVEVGGGDLVVAAGPCAVEGEDQLRAAAAAVKAAGAKLLRGGAFKPRTSPYSFQGLGERGLELLRKVGGELGLPVVSEVTDPRQVEAAYKYVDAFQVGARNAQNFELLRALGETDKPVILKRGFGETVEEWLSAADYVLLGGNENVILCERGIRTFDHTLRFTLDVGAVAAVKRLSHLPVCVDPSHPAGRREYVEPLALAGVAAGADMLLVEVHPDPGRALSDSEQQLTPSMFLDFMRKVTAVFRASRST
ncbi:3-deoxy-7-phosphoheptulonate synthase [Thermocladium modestius]|uniref:3-deoxy-7-phosphoheptulonate synthase n=2 Tax=Thermocladium modestius TaxID=62609 RepID=A0A830GT53_9CREN|nr:3-deoxy-7-phosphoheptulonate synthase [Thermocladium modestius]